MGLKVALLSDQIGEISKMFYVQCVRPIYTQSIPFLCDSEPRIESSRKIHLRQQFPNRSNDYG